MKQVATESKIEPDTEIVQRDLGGQAGLKAAEFMGPLPIQAKGMEELVVDRFDDLADARHPAPQGLWPRRLAVAFGGTEHLGTISLSPRRVV